MADAWSSLWRRTYGRRVWAWRDAPARRRRATSRTRGALRRPSPQMFRCTLLWPIQTQKLWTKVQIRQIRPTGRILNGFGDNHPQSYRFAWLGQTVQQDFDWVFEGLNIQIWNANNGMKCVPGKTEKLWCWSILKFYSKILRTRRKTNPALRSTWALTTV
jgi:hypothetical protein